VTDVAIRVQGLAKQYRIGERQRYKSLRESIMKTLAAPFRPGGRRARETIWALDDLSLEIQQGDAVGIIGRNGAGKTTLLKILSRITEPTRGRVEVHGRVGSLLEVGTGFHLELTGRENIYLNGAILGMKRAEIERKFDEIVAFAEVEKFLDTPVKHFSTGMYLRLAFAVAAHLEPEILLVDEVLAVGDASFQKKCMGKMGEVAQAGRTVLFVSHNMAAVQALCSRAVLLRSGRMQLCGGVDEVVSTYHAETSWVDGSLATRRDRQGDQRLRTSHLYIYPARGHPGDAVCVGDDTVFELHYENLSGQPVRNLEVTVGIYDFLGRAMTFLENAPVGVRIDTEKSGGIFRCVVPRLPLIPGQYVINLQLKEHLTVIDWVQQALAFTVHDGDFFATGKQTYTRLGGVFVPQSWAHEARAKGPPGP
jgi:lipopolysaccharide transport system ATP-binding protein